MYKDEIKEILDKLKDNDWYEELDLTGTKWIELKQEETNQLLDYITNLQEENRILKEIEKEYKNCTRKHCQQKCAEHCANEMIYKSRNEKAIDYIKEKARNNCWIDQYEANDLIKILQGGDKYEKKF